MSHARVISKGLLRDGLVVSVAMVVVSASDLFDGSLALVSKSLRFLSLR